MPHARAPGRTGLVAREDHDAVDEAALELQQGATGVDPCLVPASGRSVVGVQAGAADAVLTGAEPVFLQGATALNRPDFVGACRAVVGQYVPAAQPEVELPVLGRGAGARRCGFGRGLIHRQRNQRKQQ